MRKDLQQPLAIRPLLKRLGLDERECEVYLALLPLRIARASTIAKLAKQSRSHAYLILRSLQRKGLVSEIERGKILHFVAEPPERLLSYARNRQEELSEVSSLLTGALPVLRSLVSPLAGTPRVTMLHGLDGMKQIYRDMLPHEFCALFNSESMYRAFNRNIVASLFGDDMVLSGRDLLVDNAAAQRYVREVPQHASYEIRLLSKDVQFSPDTIVSGDTVALFSYDDEMTIIRIENKNIADSFRAWFEVLWQSGKKTASAFRKPMV